MGLPQLGIPAYSLLVRRYPVNRACPLSGEGPVSVLGHMRAGAVAAANAAYRPNALDVLGLSEDDEFPVVLGPTGLIFAGWLPDEPFLRALYDDAIDHTKTSSGDLWYRRFLWSMADGLLARREASDRPLRLLDYGCGHGHLARLLAGQEISAFGYEPSASKSCGGGLELLNDLDDVAARGPFDLLVCTEVLEHLADPRQALKFMRSNASPGALLLATVPDCPAPYVASALEGFARGEPQSPVFNPWEHLNYFSAPNLRHLLGEEGFEPIADLGRSQGARASIGRLNANPLATAARVAKGLLTAAPSTQLVCRAV